MSSFWFEKIGSFGKFKISDINLVFFTSIVVNVKLNKHNRSSALSRIRSPAFRVDFNTTTWDAPPPSDNPSNTQHMTSNRGVTSVKSGWSLHFNSKTHFNISINSHIEFRVVSLSSAHASANGGSGLVVGYSRLAIQNALRNHGNSCKCCMFYLRDFTDL